MSTEGQPKSEERRNFLKYAGVAVAAAAIGGGLTYYATRPTGPQPPPPTEKIRASLVVSTPVEEPWVGVVHHAMQKAVTDFGIEYDWTEKVDYADTPRVMREYAGRGFNLVVADVFGAETGAREVAKDFPNVKFFLGSGLGPVDPNVAVFDDWIHEPAYLCGMIAGKLTQSNIVGCVGGFSIPEVNRLINAYKAGVKEVNPNAKVKITFIESWFDPPKAREAAVSQIAAGADVMYAERFGVIDACKLSKTPAFGNLLDQYELGPEVVITGPVWDMWPAIKELVSSILEKRWSASDYAEWTMMPKGGAKLADWHNWETRLDQKIVARMRETNVISMVESRIKEIMAGTFRAPIEEGVPVSD